MSNATSILFPLQTDGAMHTYTLDLAANPQWRSDISALRFDPCAAAGVEVRIDKIQLIASKNLY